MSPALEGSPKQVAWAETIRSTRLEEIPVDADPGAVDLMSAKTAAAWWIETRDIRTDRLLRLLAPRIPFEVMETGIYRKFYYPEHPAPYEALGRVWDVVIDVARHQYSGIMPQGLARFKLPGADQVAKVLAAEAGLQRDDVWCFQHLLHTGVDMVVDHIVGPRR